MLRLFLSGASTIVLGGCLFPVQLGAQGWEVQFAWVTIDHDYPSEVLPELRTGEQIPTGVGISARRSLFIPNLFLEIEYTRGSENRRGTICSSYWLTGSCVYEPVEYSGGLFAGSLAGLWEHSIARSWSIGIRPELGYGTLRIREDGKETGEVYKESQAVASAGIGAEIGFRVGGKRGLRVLGIATWNHLKPIGVDIDPDARKVIQDPLPQYSVGVGVRWE